MGEIKEICYDTVNEIIGMLDDNIMDDETSGFELYELRGVLEDELGEITNETDRAYALEYFYKADAHLDDAIKYFKLLKNELTIKRK